MAESSDTREQAESDGRAQFWLGEIAQAKKRVKEWWREGTETLERYRADKRRNERGFNILWSNVETLKPSVYGRVPEPSATRRFFDEDPVGKSAAEILERALAFYADDPEYDFNETMKKVRDDNLLPGRGVARVILESPIVKVPVQTLQTEFGPRFFLGGQEVQPDGDDSDDGTAPFVEMIESQSVFDEYVYWKDYLEGDARVWEDVPWVGYMHLMTRKELKEQFGAVAIEVPLNHKPDQQDQKREGPSHALKRAVVWEIWDKEKRERVWVAEDYTKRVLDTEEDPLRLQGFFPQPGPLYAIKTTDTRIPIPEYRIYKPQADELDRITFRIGKLIEAIKVRGVYASVVKEIQNLLDGEDNEVFPVEDWAALKDRGGLEGAFAFLPIEQMAKVLVALYEQRERLKQEIFELTGLSDIMRGSSDPRETASAQNLKGNFGQVRNQPRREPMEMYIRENYRIKAELIAEHFTPENIQKITGKEVAPEVMQLLRDEKLRGFRIDIETESTVQADEQREQGNVVSFLDATSKYFQTAAEVGVTGGAPAITMMMEAYKVGARRFKMGRELEDVITQSIDELVQAAKQPKPDPAAQQAQAELQMKQQSAQIDAQIKQALAGLEAQLKQQEAQQELVIKQIEAESGIQIRRAEAAAQVEIDQANAINDAEIARVKAREASNAVN